MHPAPRTNTVGCKGADEEKNKASIATFSEKDAEAFPKYEEFLGKIREMLTPILDGSVGAPRGPLHGGRSTRAAPRGALHAGRSTRAAPRGSLHGVCSTRAAPRGGVADLFYTDARSILMVLLAFKGRHLMQAGITYSLVRMV